MSGSLGFGLDLLEKLNIRLIVPERAGLGESTFHPEKSLKSFAMDVQALLDEQSITQFSVVGFLKAPFCHGRRPLLPTYFTVYRVRARPI